MKVSRPLILIFFIFLFFNQVAEKALAQTVGNFQNLDINNLSDAQVKELLAKAQASGQTDAQLLQSARANGLSEIQIQQLQARINNVRSSSASAQKPDNVVERRLNYSPDTLRRDSVNNNLSRLRIFGADLFSGGKHTFEPNLNIATPLNYVLGPGDQLNINVYGYSVDDWKLNVSPEGNINVPHVGMVNVGGKTIEQATAIIKSRLAANNYAIGRGTNVQVSLGNIRSIKVIITGEVVKPGTYTLPSLATVFNALYSSGGPNDNGSFRKIEVIRNNRLIKTVDIYDFLLKGDQSDNIALRDQDIIRVPTYTVRVEMTGQIKRPALYEVLPGETLQQVISFSGGFTDLAYTSNVQVYQINDNERSIKDVAEADFSNYIPLRGDRYIVSQILNRFSNRVTINGAVLRPGSYAIEKNLTISRLIAKASGLSGDAYLPLGTISRLKPDNTTEVISFNVSDVVNKTGADILLQREDQVNISSIFDFHDKYTVSIKGEVRRPGEFVYSENMTVQNLIIQAGGFTVGATPKRIIVSRRVDNDKPNSLNGTTTEVFNINADELGSNNAGFVLKPFDIVSIFKSAGFEKQRMVKIEGEVFYPGYYPIATKSERISDLIKNAGGLLSTAYVDGASLKRKNSSLLNFDKEEVDTTLLQRERNARLRRLSLAVNNTDTTLAITDNPQLENNYVGINLKKILDKPNSATDIILQDGDVLSVPKLQQTVKVNGHVLFPSSIIYSSGKSFKSYINNAGGFSASAHKRKSYLIYPNGTVKATKKFLFFPFYPRVKPGSEIFVPKKPVTRKISTQEAIGITGGLASLALIIVTLINQK